MNEYLDIGKKYYAIFEFGTLQLQSAVLLILRLFFGLDLIITALGHLGNVPAMVDRFTKWGVPFPHLNVYISGYTELLGGALITLGLLTRLISVPLVFNFIVAYLTASRETVMNLFTHPWPKGIDDFTGDAAFFFLMGSLVFLAFGAGRVSVDHILERTCCRTDRSKAGFDVKLVTTPA